MVLPRHPASGAALPGVLRATRIGITLDTWPAAIIALSLNTGAYVAETFRSAYASIPRGQFEAARTLNFTKMQTLRHVVVPQATRIALPRWATT